jgi:hypothetical protein
MRPTLDRFRDYYETTKIHRNRINRLGRAVRTPSFVERLQDVTNKCLLVVRAVAHRLGAAVKKR